MGPMELAAIAESQLQCKDDGIQRIAELYVLCRYAHNAGNQAELAELINRFQPRATS
jgi:hypothetical protein